MEELSKNNWIFFLNLSEKLPRNFFILSQFFKDRSITLVPINYTALLQFTRESDRIHIICMVSNMNELSRYNKIKKYFKLMIQNNILDLYMASSFQGLDETNSFRGKKNYHYIKLPIEAELLCEIIFKTVDIKQNQKLSWPGGKSPRPTMLNQL